jgi:hypothetical protein
LSAIRSAVEALIGYPEMAPEKRDAFQKIIYKESLTLPRYWIAWPMNAPASSGITGHRMAMGRFSPSRSSAGSSTVPMPLWFA